VAQEKEGFNREEGLNSRRGFNARKDPKSKWGEKRLGREI